MLTLRLGSSSVVVAPATGAGLLGWMAGRTPLLRRALPEAVIGGNQHALSCFPLLPYCNRIGLRRFAWDGREYHLRDNFGGNEHTLHGVGWQRPWTVLEASDQHVVLGLEHAPDADWPFAFEARVTYRLSGTGLSAGLALTNRHSAPAPAGLGLHPYFPKVPDAALRFSASGAWRNGDDALPRHHGPVPADWSYRPARAVAATQLDNCFTGWDGAVDVLAGAASLRIEAEQVFGNLQVFTPPWADFFCAEPVSHVPDAINRPDLPAEQAMARLDPGATLAGEIRLLMDSGH